MPKEETLAGAKTAGRNVPGKPDASRSTLERIVAALRHGLRAGRFVPGQHLLEPELTRQLNCSRGSLRAAMMHLAAEGIVTLSRFRGARISVLDRKTIGDLLDVLEHLIDFAAARAAQKIDLPGNRERVERAAAELSAFRSSGDNAGYLEKRQAFYDAIIAVSDNSELGRIMPTPRADLLRVQLYPIQSVAHREAHVDGYAAIAEAILSGDVPKTRHAVRQHLQTTRQALAELPKGAFENSLEPPAPA